MLRGRLRLRRHASATTAARVAVAVRRLGTGRLLRLRVGLRDGRGQWTSDTADGRGQRTPDAADAVVVRLLPATAAAAATRTATAAS